MNVKALQGIQKKMDDEAGGGNLFFPQKKIGEETVIRILPPDAKLEGMYFRQIVKWWVANKPYTSLETFGEKCPITEYVEKMTASLKKNPNPELHALLSDTKKLKKSKEFWIPILLLNEDGKPVGDHPHRVFQCGPACLREINKVVTSRFFQNDTEDGITDRRQGRNISLGRTGEGLDTEYKAQGWPEPSSMPKDLYTDEARTPVDVFDLVEKQRKTEKELLAVIKNYLEGTPIDEDTDDDEDEKPTKKKKSSIASTKERRDPINDLKRMQEDDDEEDGDDDDEEEDEKPAKAKGKEKPQAKPAPADDDDDDDEDEDDEEEEDDDDEEDEPVKKSAKAKGKPADDDEEEDDDDEEDDDSDDDDDDDEEEDEKPAPKAKPNKAGKTAPQAKPSSGSSKSGSKKKDTDGLNDD